MATVPNALALRNRRRIWRCPWEMEAPGGEWRLETKVVEIVRERWKETARVK